jgi:hypothetical protein
LHHFICIKISWLICTHMTYFLLTWLDAHVFAITCVLNWHAPMWDIWKIRCQHFISFYIFWASHINMSHLMIENPPCMPSRLPEYVHISICMNLCALAPCLLLPKFASHEHIVLYHGYFNKLFFLSCHMSTNKIKWEPIK